jgi:ketosteroid isomerase-like protein
MTGANDSLIERFYRALARRDGAAMEACYALDVRFSDPVFPDLRGARAGAMWRMLTAQGKDIELELVEHDADEQRGTARWVARYTFNETGRQVVNDVRASFRFGDGLIVEHRDQFGFYRWARQALGPPGLLLGWTPLMRSAVRRRAATSLDRFLATEQ